MSHQPRISIVLSTLGNYDGLRRVLDSYEQQTARGQFEVLVVGDIADSEPERTDAAIGSRPFEVRRLTGHRRGLSANRNAGAAAARGRLVLFTDNDTIASPALLSEHLSWHKRYSEEAVGVLGHVRWAQELRLTAFMHWLDYGVQFDYPNIQGIEAGWGRFYGANVSVKRSLIDRVGGFDEVRLPYLYEDLDFGYRASKIGFRLLYNRHAEVEHLRTMDLDFWRSKMRRLASAERAFVRIHPEIPPYFRNLFAAAIKAPPARGRGRFLIRHVPRGVPVVGDRAWTSADLYYRQALAPIFLAAWEDETADAPEDGPIAPYLLEREAVPSQSSGSPPGGPK
ncbi:MAG: glycosyltransferase [Actinomycetota bacterium]|nr:glycosyltransferase [Actinomycetota bacterium]